MDLLKKVSLYKINEVKENTLIIEDLLKTKKIKEEINWSDPCQKIADGDIILLIKEKRKSNNKENIVIHYPVKKIKGRFSDVKDYIYFKMKVLYDFNLHYLDKKEIEAVSKDPAHIKFENLMKKNKEKIKKLITYNSDENVIPFNHTDYEVKTILNSKKIFRQEIGDQFDWGWSLMEIYQLGQENFVSFKQSSYFRERQRGEFFEISKQAVDFMRDFEDDKDDFLD